MSSKPELKLDWCSFDAVKYAVTKWHYSKAMPTGKLIKIGVWEGGLFVGAIIFSRGAAPQSHCPYGIERTEICELTRVALNKHAWPVSRMLAIAIKMLKNKCPGLRLIVSYADPEQGHHGGIYAAGGWTYSGTISDTHFECVKTGKRIHSKTLKTGRKGHAAKLLRERKIRKIRLIKHKYLMPLDEAMKMQVSKLSKKYPKPRQK